MPGCFEISMPVDVAYSAKVSHILAHITSSQMLTSIIRRGAGEKPNEKLSTPSDYQPEGCTVACGRGRIGYCLAFVLYTLPTTLLTSSQILS